MLLLLAGPPSKEESNHFYFFIFVGSPALPSWGVFLFRKSDIPLEGVVSFPVSV